MATTFSLAGISTYVDESHDDLIKAAVLGAKSIDEFQLQTGVKGKTSINLLDATVVFQDGSECGFSDNGALTVTKRYIEPAILKVDMAFCEKDLLGHAEQHLIKVGAGKESNPWEQAFTEMLNGRANEAVEKMIWQGDSSTLGSVEFDGLTTILATESATLTDIVVDVTAQDTVWDKVVAVYTAIPEEVIAESTIYVSPAVYRGLVQELTASNLYHYLVTDDKDRITLPGTTVSVVNKPGLTGADYDIVALQPDHTYVGVDMKGDEETWKIGYFEKDEEWYWKLRFAMGVQVAFPANCRMASSTAEAE